MPRFLAADAVAAVLAHFPEEQFESTPTELQAGFRQVAREFPELLGQVSFGKVGGYVSSPTIDAALDSLAAAGFYSRYNKDLVTHELNIAKLSSYYKTFLAQRFNAAGISEQVIKRAAETLRDELNDIYQSPSRDRLLVT